MELRGLRPEVITALTRVPEVKRQVAAVARQIRDDARASAPRKTGRLRRSIRVDNVLDPETGQVVYRVGWDKSIAYWGPMVEGGTRRTRARPHLVPAVLKAGGRRN